ncbi:hypothetical protein BOX15_Mlig031711g1 [Macrostomum lignano]|uniref:Uncharacterized protein n=1 Tax=Macrostomum lignano TaxID=282301 RepID=A0A267DLR5_9PLAT|nr:hypothetical protein BOX15_Mlig031711g1 [Macrostomum lignano]
MERRGDHGGKYQTPLPYTPFLTVAAADSLEQQTAAPPTKQLRQQGPIAISTTLAPGSHPPSGPGRPRGVIVSNGAAPSPPLSGSTASPRSPQLEPTPPPPPPPPPPPQPLSQAEPSVTELTANCSPRQVADWLRRQRFNTLTGVFKNFSGYDLLRLSRNDLTEICGVGEGIRLANAILQRPCRSRLVFFVSQETDSVFHPVYLSQLTYEELFNRITSLFQADGDKISQVLVYGPTSIAVCITDEMVAQMESESKYTLHVQPDLADPGRFRVFMRERRHHCAKGGNSGAQESSPA